MHVYLGFYISVTLGFFFLVKCIPYSELFIHLFEK